MKVQNCQPHRAKMQEPQAEPRRAAGNQADQSLLALASSQTRPPWGAFGIPPDAGQVLLHLLALRLLSAQVLLHTIVQDGAYAKGPVVLDQGPDGLLVLASHKMTIEGHLH